MLMLIRPFPRDSGFTKPHILNAKCRRPKDLVVQIETTTYLVLTMRHRLINVSHLHGEVHRYTAGCFAYGSTLKPYQKKQAQHTRPVKSVAPSHGPPKGGLPNTYRPVICYMMCGRSDRQKLTIVSGKLAHT